MKRLGVGIVGCGEAAQIMHLPALRLLEDRFELVAVCDRDKEVAEAVGARWQAPARLTDWTELVALADVDVVLVTAPHALHAPVTLAALEHGKSVLVEKPICLTFEEADAVIAAQQRLRGVVQVGYMRRHAPALVEARELLPGIGTIRLARIHDVLGHNELISEQTANVITSTATSAPNGSITEERRQALQAIGVDDPWLADTYEFLLTLNSHDLSAMRDLFGMPSQVLYAARRDGPQSPFITAAFDYGDFVCHLETGFDRLPRTDQHIRVFAEETDLEVRWGSGFVRHSPVTLTVTEASGAGVAASVRQPDWSDPFVHEWRALYACVVDGAPNRWGPADARLDLELALAIVQAIAHQSAVTIGAQPPEKELL